VGSGKLPSLLFSSPQDYFCSVNVLADASALQRLKYSFFHERFCEWEINGVPQVNRSFSGINHTL
jgi:hypothetical protein